MLRTLPESLAFENAVMEHLHAAGITVPSVYRVQSSSAAAPAPSASASSVSCVELVPQSTVLQLSSCPSADGLAKDTLANTYGVRLVGYLDGDLLRDHASALLQSQPSVVVGSSLLTEAIEQPVVSIMSSASNHTSPSDPTAHGINPHALAYNLGSTFGQMDRSLMTWTAEHASDQAWLQGAQRFSVWDLDRCYDVVQDLIGYLEPRSDDAPLQHASGSNDKGVRAQPHPSDSHSVHENRVVAKHSAAAVPEPAVPVGFELVRRVADAYKARIACVVPQLRKSVIHNDGNEENVSDSCMHGSDGLD